MGWKPIRKLNLTKMKTNEKPSKNMLGFFSFIQAIIIDSFKIKIKEKMVVFYIHSSGFSLIVPATRFFASEGSHENEFKK